jgi:hypothetical protein
MGRGKSDATGFSEAPASAVSIERDRGYADPRLPHGTGYCRCGACGLYFRSDSGFMQHRRGGRCLSPDELRAKGLSVNAGGYWIREVYDREKTP